MEEKQLQEKLDQLKSALEESLTKKQKAEIEAQLKAVNEAIAALKAVQPASELIAGLETQLKELKEAADKNQPVIDAFVATRSDKPAALKSFEQVLSEAIAEKTDEFAKMGERSKKDQAIEITIDRKAVADFSTANVTGGSVWGAIYRPGIIENPSQIGHVRNFIPTSSAGPGTDYYFMRENGAGEGAPAPTAEKKAAAATTVGTGLKPAFDIDLVEASVKFETIAGIMPMSRKALKNIPGLVSFLNMRVPQKLLDVEDAQILYGDGNTPNLKGILTAGNYVASTADDAPLVDRILTDIGNFEDTYKRVANGIMLRPAAIMSFMKNKAAAGSGTYDLPQGVTFVNGQLYIMGIPVFKTTALTTGDYVVADRMGAELLIQDALTLQFFEQDGTNVRTNQVTLRVEETVALPVYGSNYFMLGSTNDASFAS